MNTVDVLLAGKLVPGADQDRAAAALAKMTGLDPAKTRLLLCSGKPRLAKRGLTPAAGEALVRVIFMMIQNADTGNFPVSDCNGNFDWTVISS